MKSAEREKNTIVLADSGSMTDEQYRSFEDDVLFRAMDVATSEDAQSFLNGLDKAKRLMAAREYRKWRKKFQLLEVECYITLWENGWTEELQEMLTPSEFEALEWLCGLSKDERNEVIHRDILFTTSYKHAKKKEMFEQNVHYNADSVAEITDSWAKDRVYEYVTEGKTDISSDSLTQALDKDNLTYPGSIVHNTVDGTKDKLLRAGAIGIGDGQYVSKSNEDDIVKGLDKRLTNLVAAFESFQELSDMLDGNYVINTAHQGSKKLKTSAFIGIALGMMFAQDNKGKVSLQYSNDYYGMNNMKTFISMVKLFAKSTGFVPEKSMTKRTFFNAALALKYGDEVELVLTDDHNAIVDGDSIYGPTSHPALAEAVNA